LAKLPKLKKISGMKCIKILCNIYGFKIKRQTGSHIILIKESSGIKFGTVVPNHKELKIGTLKGILKLAKIEEKDFFKHL
jgi:predicted RNA binding protein YcfA (HicA-like mRNA interferase family)